MTLGSLLILAAVILFAYNKWDSWRAGQAALKIQKAIESAEDNQNANSDNGSSDELQVEIDGNNYIGALSVERFGLYLPVLSQWSYPGLKVSPCRYSGTAETNDLVICGHNYDRHFGKLKNLEAGDTVTFTAASGVKTDYSVSEVIVLQPTAVEEMINNQSGKWDLTLFTCTSSGRARVTVRCTKIEKSTEEYAS